MGIRRVSSLSGRDGGLWPVISLLLVAVAVPTACVVWFMTEAMRNERLAVRQRLTTLYQGQLHALELRVHDCWVKKQDALAAINTDALAPEIFASLIEAGVADSCIVYDAAGRVTYPASPGVETTGEVVESTEWSHARRLEHESLDNLAAAGAYESIAREAADAGIAARALQAQARCLVKAGQADAAIEILTETLAQDQYGLVANAQGRLIALNSQLMAMELIGDAKNSEFRRIADSLGLRLSDYGDPALSANQRRFLMNRLRWLMPADAAFATLDAENLAARYIESDCSPPRGSSLQRSGLPDVWQLRSQNGRLLALFFEGSVVGEMRSLSAAQALPEDVTVEVLPPGSESSHRSANFTRLLNGYLDGWRLALHVGDRRLFDAAAEKQIVAYFWTGTLVIVVIVIVVALFAGAIRRQMRLARLKNDLVATVSHELKTPLSSMRLLVDTLLDDERFDEGKVREYLQLISKENARLSHLIDNFLTFSRMQRNKRAFKMDEIEAANVAKRAMEIVGEKLTTAQCRFDVQIAPALPRIMADADALVTVVINLLDNAYKYTEADKQIALRTYANGAHVCFEVQDNGIGFSRRAAKRVFQRFYQADQRLSRSSGGCGLGLSIVQFIVTAHGGSVSVDSESGRGSTFTVSLPAVLPNSAKTVECQVR